MATARASVADIRPWQLGQPREELPRPRRVEQKSLSSRKCRFPRPSLVAAIIFPHTKWLPKITDYRDTAALISYIPYGRHMQFSSIRNSEYCFKTSSKRETTIAKVLWEAFRLHGVFSLENCRREVIESKNYPNSIWKSSCVQVFVTPFSLSQTFIEMKVCECYWRNIYAYGNFCDWLHYLIHYLGPLSSESCWLDWKLRVKKNHRLLAAEV